MAVVVCVTASQLVVSLVPVFRIVAMKAVYCVVAPSRCPTQVNLGYTKFEHLERACSRDLNRWLATLYISVTRLPREELDASGAVLSREFDMEVTYTSQLLRIRGKDRY